MTEHDWELTKKMSYKRRWGRISLSVMQVRGASSSPWYVTLEGIGSDPETGKPPSVQLSPDIPDVWAQQRALRWALPHITAFAEHASNATRDVEDLLSRSDTGDGA